MLPGSVAKYGQWQGIVGRTTADLAARFLDKVLNRMPFKVTVIQVDGGSVFVAGVEHAGNTSSTSGGRCS